jgi:hypothetical protein
MEDIVVLVPSHFRQLASAPKVHWLAEAVAPGDCQIEFKDPIETLMHLNGFLLKPV